MKTTWMQAYNSTFEMGKNRHVAMPKGFTYRDGGIYCNTTGLNYPYGSTFTANKNYDFECSDFPINYTVTYDLDGGTQNTSNQLHIMLFMKRNYIIQVEQVIHLLVGLRQIIF